jgi:uncharacterized protein (TIGR02452 family)
VSLYGGDKLSTLERLEYEPLDTPFERFTTEFRFSKTTSRNAARVMHRETDEKIAILNLANRRQPGGIGLAPYGGSQEEDLVRHSNLAWVLDPRFETEKVHAKMAELRRSEGYGDAPFEHHIPYFGVIYSKNVTFFESGALRQYDVISSAAPDLRRGSDETQFLMQFDASAPFARQQILVNKIKAIFDAALAEDTRHLILGAYGCGVFENKSTEVAGIFADLLKNNPLYQGRFKQITFAITDQVKLDIFRQAFHI